MLIKLYIHKNCDITCNSIYESKRFRILITYVILNVFIFKVKIHTSVNNNSLALSNTNELLYCICGHNIENSTDRPYNRYDYERNR